MLMEGEMVPGTGGRRWVVGRKLGQGTCCQAFEVTLHGEEKTKAAIKVYKEGENFAGAHDREAMLLELVHKNAHCKYLVTVIDDFDYKDHPCLVQELLDCDLRQTIHKSRDKGLSFHTIQILANHIFQGVRRIHRAGFVHGDLKPTNLLWDPQTHTLKVIDLSLSFHYDDETIGLLQSQGYRAPEIELWNRHLSEKSDRADDVGIGNNPPRPNQFCDLWSLGCVLVEMYTGEKMFTRQKVQEIMNMQSKVEAGGGTMIMSVWLSQVLKPRVQDSRLDNKDHLLREFTDLVICLMQFEGKNRLTADGCLQHPFFALPTVASHLDLLILPSPVIRLTNVLDPRDMHNAQLLKEIKEDIEEECEQYGAVKQTVIPVQGPGLAKVYVEFLYASAAMTAFSKLCKKTFSGRTIIITFYPLDRFREQTYF